MFQGIGKSSSLRFPGKSWDALLTEGQITQIPLTNVLSWPPRIMTIIFFYMWSGEYRSMLCSITFIINHALQDLGSKVITSKERTLFATRPHHASLIRFLGTSIDFYTYSFFFALFFAP